MTKGRKKRKRKPGARTGVAVKAHSRSPRGPDRGKTRVIVDSYQRGKPRNTPKSSASRRKKRRKRRR
jgi:hypothetical protein